MRHPEVSPERSLYAGSGYSCAWYRAGRLSLIVGDGLLVMEAWPPRAWYRAHPVAAWRHVRPAAFDLRMTEPLRRIRRAQRRTPRGLWTLYEQHGATVQAFLDQGGTPVPRCPESVNAILHRLAETRYRLHGPEADDLARAASRLRPVLSWFSRLDQDLRAFQDFYGAIPPEVREAVMVFPERHYSLLSFCARCPGGLDLLRSTPALGFMLANCWVFGRKVQRPLRSCRALLRRTQREQLGWLGFPGASKSEVRILRKVPAACCTVKTLLYLRSAMRSGQPGKWLRHLPQINAGVVRLVSDPRLLPHATYSLLEEVALCPGENARARLGHRMARALPLFDEKLPCCQARFRSMAAFSGFLQVAEDMGWDQLCSLVPRDFPRPPYPGNDWLVPLRNLRELVCEGMVQRHCIANAADRVCWGRAYVYRVLVPGNRATLLIERETRGRPWFLADCRAAANKPTDAALLQRIQFWLDMNHAIKNPKPSDDIPGQLYFPWNA
jgi:hypothetical protein